MVGELTVPFSPSLIWALGQLEADPVSRDQWSVGAGNDASTKAQGDSWSAGHCFLRASVSGSQRLEGPRAGTQLPEDRS